MERGKKVDKVSIVIYASLSLYNKRPALVLRRVLTDPEVVKLLSLVLIERGVVELPAMIVVSKPLAFVGNARRFGIIK